VKERSEMGMQLRRPTQEPPPVLLKVRIRGRVAEKLELYRALYAEHYGEEIRVEALAAEIIAQFLAREPALRRRARERRNSDGPGSTFGDNTRAQRRPEPP
jgi:hypothetical protein